MSGCTVDTGDDNCAVKEGTRNVLVERCHFLNGHGSSIGRCAQPRSATLSHTQSRSATLSSGVHILPPWHAVSWQAGSLARRPGACGQRCGSSQAPEVLRAGNAPTLHAAIGHLAFGCSNTRYSICPGVRSRSARSSPRCSMHRFYECGFTSADCSA